MLSRRTHNAALWAVCADGWRDPHLDGGFERIDPVVVGQGTWLFPDTG
jgi:hypothetical protein